MRVLSIFDGMSVGYLALQRAGVVVDKYYSSEIDKYAIEVSNKNFKNIIRLGDINSFSGGAAWPSNTDIDIIIGGSPCQGFSFAGKQLAFDDPRSALFFKFVEIINYYQPKYFLLENVRMKQEYQDVISKYLGVEPVVINSSLVSAQNRVRYYWTNIPNITLPKDKGVILEDILEDRQQFGGRMVGRKINSKGKREDYAPNIATTQYIEVRKDNKMNCLTTVSKDSLVLIGLAKDVLGWDCRRRAYPTTGKCPTLLANSGGQSQPKISIDGIKYRKLTPLECERLQTLPDNYTSGVSNSQRYKMLGNGWTCDVISHIFNNLRA